jgi:hypothetical protein
MERVMATFQLQRFKICHYPMRAAVQWNRHSTCHHWIVLKSSGDVSKRRLCAEFWNRTFAGFAPQREHILLLLLLLLFPQFYTNFFINRALVMEAVSTSETSVNFNHTYKAQHPRRQPSSRNKLDTCLTVGQDQRLADHWQKRQAVIFNIIRYSYGIPVHEVGFLRHYLTFPREAPFSPEFPHMFH